MYVSLYIMLFTIFLLFSVFGVYKKTGNAFVSASIWGVIMGILFISISGISLKLLSVLLSFLIALGTFSLANYFEETIFLRLFILLFGIFATFISLGVIQ